MQLIRFAVIGSFFLTACAGMPPKPQVELCVLDYARGEASCGLTGGEKIKSTQQLKYEALAEEILTSANSVRVPISSMDKAIMFRPLQWELVQNYIDLLVNYAKKKAQSQNSCVNFEPMSP